MLTQVRGNPISIQPHLEWNMSRQFGLLAIAVTMAGVLVACGSGEDDTESQHQIMRTLDGISAASITLVGGTTVNFPANTFESETIVIIADLFLSNDATSVYFPTTTPESNDLLGAIVINTPIDEMLHHNLGITFELQDFDAEMTPSQVGGVAAGQEYAVYRFDFDNLRWNRWGDTSVTIDGGRMFATGLIPTDGMRGFIGSVAIFRGNDLNSLPAPVQTTLSGRLVDNQGNAVATDVGIYLMVGALKYAASLDNGRIPDLLQPTDERQQIDKFNTVNSGADGWFTMELPDNMVGQLVNLEFGHEQAGRIIQEEFDVLAPANPVNELISTVIRYGENNIISRPVEL